MAQTFNCPSCGAPLETDGNEATIHCEYCGESVIVPSELRTSSQNQQQPGNIPMQPQQPVSPGNIPGKLDVSLVRQMMMAIRSGQTADAVRIFQNGTGTSPEMASQTIDTIAQQIAISNRILPGELAALMMGAYQARGQRNYSASSPLMPTRPIRRRGGRLGCLLALVIVILAAYLSYTALSPSQLISAFSSGKENTSLHQTAVAPVSVFSTAIAPIIGKSTGANK